MGVLAWIIFGALAGWIASLIIGSDNEQGAAANIIIGIIGAFIGGFVAQMLGGSGVTGFNVGSLLVAILGSVNLIALIHTISGSRRTTS